MSRTPFMQLYPADYLADTMDLTTEQHGAYLLILMTMWQHDAKLPDDPKKLARISRMTPAKFAAVWSEISRFFHVEDGTITNLRLTKERKKAAEKSQKRASAGSAGGRAKALKDNEARLANAMPAPCHSPDIRNQIEERGDTNVSLSAEPTPDALPHLDETAEAVAEYNAAASEQGWPKVQVLSKARRSSLNARLKECGGIQGWRDALAKARASPLCTGQNDRGWVADFDFLIKQSKFIKLMEGAYDARKPANQNRETAKSDALRDTLNDAARMRRTSEPNWL